MINYGYQNEYDFVKLFNDKYYYELDGQSQKFLLELFGTGIAEAKNEKIICWKNRANQKADIFIKYKNFVKGISLKCGKSNSVHAEPVQEFKRYLGNLNIPYKIINKYLDYHYGYMRNEKNEINFSRVLSAEEYKVYYQNEIDIFNKSINQTRIIIDMIDRFLVRGRNSDYDIDAFISGITDDYVWIMKHDLYDLILSKRNLNCTSPHVACMTIGPKKRNLDGNSNNFKDRYIVCIRWNFIKEDILNFRKDR